MATSQCEPKDVPLLSTTSLTDTTVTHPLTPATPLSIQHNPTLCTGKSTPINIVNLQPSSCHPSGSPPSPTATEIATPPPTPEKHTLKEILHQAGIKVRDFAYKPVMVPNLYMAPQELASPIAADRQVLKLNPKRGPTPSSSSELDDSPLLIFPNCVRRSQPSNMPDGFLLPDT